jgi:thiol:disulfide interchange protein
MMRGAVLLMAMLAVTGCLAGPEDAAAGKIQWVPNVSEGLRLAKESGKPVMLFFTADWCAPCVELKKYTFTDRRVVAASQRLINVYIDVDSDFETLSAYKVRGIPAIFFLNPLGQIISKYNGDRSPGSFVKEMTAVADKHTR